MGGRKKLRILAELRPTAEGFAGIPQETRLVFSSLLSNPTLEMTGLINSQNRTLRRALDPTSTETVTNFRRIDLLSKFVVSNRPPNRRKSIVTRYLENLFGIQTEELGLPIEDFLLSMRSIVGIDHRLTVFDSREFHDFIWNNFFSASLSLDDFDKIVSGDYRTIRPSWEAMQRTTRFVGDHAISPRLNTRDFDFLLAQTPFPGKLAKKTRMIVRYHDGISVFMPHTVPLPFARTAHVNSLKLNAPHATFVCTSAASRSDLLKLCPQVEPRAHVIHNMVADSYFVETAPVERIVDLATKYMDPSTSPKFQRLRDQSRYYAELNRPPGFKYILMVSTLEPRKNHLRLIQAWEWLRAKHIPELRLVFVGSVGWHAKPILKAMNTWQERGQLLHLSAVPAPGLRLLYNAARCVVCPSTAEGFDQSGIEAMLCGGVSVSSDIPVHREVYGDASIYFDPYSIEDQANAILSVIADTPAAAVRRDSLRIRGLAHADQYRQSHVAQKWQGLFEQLAGGQ